MALLINDFDAVFKAAILVGRSEVCERAFRPVQPGAELTLELRFDSEIERDADRQILSLGGAT
ncbi:hypothetical protein [Maricaulis sp.]|uniref:hypothetical protein n=1 Tax=Maricaulis sp. TaxID=1486257 RepID=UPI002B267C88|nr:hypothetical protein [Maricaulis sp.]